MKRSSAKSAFSKRHSFKRSLKRELSRDFDLRKIETAFAENEGATISALFSLACSPDELLKKRIGDAFEKFSETLCSKGKKSKVRTLIRRCVWNLTEESGGIPWGYPEAFAALMAGNRELAEEYADIYFSYILESEKGADNFIDYAPLRKGFYTGIERLAKKFPSLVAERKNFVLEAKERETDEEILKRIERILATI